jgi:ABC-type branched-subunit amino acid transport system substrate-binding protein
MRALPVLSVLALTGCLESPVATCSLDSECRDAFGFGMVCGDEGYCEDVEVPARCASSYPDDLLENRDAYRDAIVLGSVYDAAWDIAEMQSVRLAFLQASEGDGLDGHTLGIVRCSYEENHDGDGLDYAGAVNEVGTFLRGELGVPGFIGPYTSSETEALWNALASSDAGPAFIISPSATSPALTYIDGLTKSDAEPGLLWRSAPPDSLQGQVAAQDMVNRDVSKVAVLYEDGPYGVGLADIFQDEFASAGGTVLRMEFNSDTTMAEHNAAIKSDATIQEVFFISAETSTIASWLKVAHSTGSVGTRGIFLSDAAADTDMLTDAADAAALFPQIRGTRPVEPSGTLYDTFAAAYQATYDQDPYATIYMPYAYDAAWLAAYAVAWSHFQEGAVTPEGMGSGMRRVSSGTEIELKSSTWSTLKAAFQDGAGVDVQGTTGSLDYDPETEETTAPIEVWTVNLAGDGFEGQYVTEP